MEEKLSEDRCPTKPVDNRLYNARLRAQSNAGLAAVRLSVWIGLIIVGAGIHIIFRTSIGSVTADVLSVIAAISLDRYLCTRFEAVRLMIQGALSIRYKRDFRAYPLVGISPAAGPVLFDGDLSWDVGFLEVEESHLVYYGDMVEFSLASNEIVRVAASREREVTVTWEQPDGQLNLLRIGVKQSPNEALTIATMRLARALSRLQQRHADIELEGDFPPVFEATDLAHALEVTTHPRSIQAHRDWVARKKLANTLPMTTPGGKTLDQLVWRCGCGEVNVMSRRQCRLCGSSHLVANT